MRSWAAPLALGVVLGFGLAVSLVHPGTVIPATPMLRRQAARRDPARSHDLKSIITGSVRSFTADQIPAVAGGVTFFALLALFPALSAFVSLYGLFGDVDAARRGLAGLTGLLPEGAITVLQEQLDRLAHANHGRLGLAFGFSLMVSLWSSNAGVKALISGLNDAYEVREHRGFITLNLRSLAFTAGAVLFSVLAASVVVIAPATLGALGLGGLAAVAALRWPAVLLLVTGLVSLLYRYGPCRPHARWRAATPGGAVTAFAWVGMSLGFSWYVANFGHYDRTYGSLGAIVGFLTWIWLSIMVVLYGAELNAELDI